MSNAFTPNYLQVPSAGNSNITLIDQNAANSLYKAEKDKRDKYAYELQVQNALLSKEANEIELKKAKGILEEQAAKKTIIANGGTNATEDILKSSMSTDDKSNMLFSKLFDDVKQLTPATAAKVKSDIDKYGDILTPAQTEVVRKEFDSGVSSLAKQFNTTGTNEQKNIYSSPKYKEAVYAIEKEAENKVNSTEYMNVREAMITAIDSIKADKKLTNVEKDKQIAEVQKSYKSYRDNNLDTINSTNASIEENKKLQLKTLNDNYTSMFSDLTNLLSGTAKADMDTYINGEKKNLETATIALNTADKAVYQGRADELIKEVAKSTGTKVLSEEQFLKAMVKARQKQEDEDRKIYGGPKTTVTLDSIKKDLFNEGLEFDQNNIFKRYEDVRQEIVKPKLEHIKSQLDIAGKQLSNENAKISNESNRIALEEQKNIKANGGLTPAQLTLHNKVLTTELGPEFTKLMILHTAQKDEIDPKTKKVILKKGELNRNAFSKEQLALFDAASIKAKTAALHGYKEDTELSEGRKKWFSAVDSATEGNGNALTKLSEELIADGYTQNDIYRAMGNTRIGMGFWDFKHPDVSTAELKANVMRINPAVTKKLEEAAKKGNNLLQPIADKYNAGKVNPFLTNTTNPYLKNGGFIVVK